MKKYSYKKIVIIFLLSFCVLFFIAHRLYTQGQSRLDTVFACVAYPFLVSSSWCVSKVCNAKKYVKELFVNRDRLALLENQQHLLYNELVQLQAYAMVKEESKQLRDFNQRYAISHRFIVKVLGYRHTLEGEQFLLLDAGSWQGIKQQAVVVSDNMLIGKVTHVYPWYCRVMLVIDKRFQAAAVCTKTKIKGIYAGTGNGMQGQLLHVERIEKPQLGDTVLSSGEGAVFPYGFGIGTIENIQDDGLYHAVTIRPFIDFSSLAYCSILQS